MRESPILALPAGEAQCGACDRSPPPAQPATETGWRRTWFEIIYRHDTRPSRNFDLLLVYAIIASVLVVMFDSVQRFHIAHADWLYVLEWGFTILFTAEYLLRLVVVKRPLRYAFSIWGIIDLASILPTYLSLFIPARRACWWCAPCASCGCSASSS